MQHKVGDLVHGGFGLGMIVKKTNIGDCIIEWYCPQKDQLRTKFYYEEIAFMKERLNEEKNKSQNR
jgi:hypothetical protein